MKYWIRKCFEDEDEELKKILDMRIVVMNWSFVYPYIRLVPEEL